MRKNVPKPQKPGIMGQPGQNHVERKIDQEHKKDDPQAERENNSQQGAYHGDHLYGKKTYGQPQNHSPLTDRLVRSELLHPFGAIRLSLSGR